MISWTPPPGEGRRDLDSTLEVCPEDVALYCNCDTGDESGGGM